MNKTREPCDLSRVTPEQAAEWLASNFSNEEFCKLFTTLVSCLAERRRVHQVPCDGKAYLDLQICVGLDEISKLLRSEEDRYPIHRKHEETEDYKTTNISVRQEAAA